MKQSLAHVALVASDDDEAIAFHTGEPGFRRVEDTCPPESGLRCGWRPAPAAKKTLGSLGRLE